ncbi:hypothetical protein ACIP5Y_05615 [Nocardia sp. NPDC088792]|uniref:hypothetical protein n=1 Tax=Nocardia sp. NPDC088792 TaxID=3364332 RepID=UPI0038008E76
MIRLAGTMLEWVIPVVLAGWFVASVLGQHPDRSYDKVRLLDKTGADVLIPNWRFFAPNPATDDVHFLYRLANEDKTEHTEWEEAYPAARRRLVHAIWFPGRRIEKSVFDVSSAYFGDPASLAPLINEFVRARLTPRPAYPFFQVMLVRYAGYDHSEDPKYDAVLDYERVHP